jgi:hypothetical protein
MNTDGISIIKILDLLEIYLFVNVAYKVLADFIFNHHYYSDSQLFSTKIIDEKKYDD